MRAATRGLSRGASRWVRQPAPWTFNLDPASATKSDPNALENGGDPFELVAGDVLEGTLEVGGVATPDPRDGLCFSWPAIDVHGFHIDATSAAATRAFMFRTLIELGSLPGVGEDVACTVGITDVADVSTATELRACTFRDNLGAEEVGAIRVAGGALTASYSALANMDAVDGSYACARDGLRQASAVGMIGGGASAVSALGGLVSLAGFAYWFVSFHRPTIGGAPAATTFGFAPYWLGLTSPPGGLAP